MEYIPLSIDLHSEPWGYSLGDLEQPVFFNNGEDPYKLMEELYSTIPPSWFEEANALLYSGKGPNVITVGDLSMPAPEPSASPEPYDYSNIDIGYSPMPVPELTASPEPSDYSYHIDIGHSPMSVSEFNNDTSVGYPSMPVPELTVYPEPFQYSNVDVGYPPMPVPELGVSPEPFHYSCNIDVEYPSVPIPELVFPEPMDYSVHQWQYCSTNLEPVPYVVQQGYPDPSMRYYDASYIGYTALPSHSTHWELDISNSLNLSHTNHMEFGMTNFDILSNNVMRKFQELEFPPAFGSDQHVVGNTSGYPISEPPLYPIAYDESIPGLSFIPTTLSSPSFFSTPEALPYSSPAETTTSQSFPTTPEGLQYSFPSTMGFSSPSCPTTPDNLPSPPHHGLPYSSPVATAERHPPPLRLPTKKRGRKPKNDTKASPTQQKPRRRFPNGRSAIRSQAWVDRCFLDGICQLCTGGTSKNRPDRVLEHLVSTHFFQAVKNVECFDTEHIVQAAGVRRHFMGTKEQFEYTRQYVNVIRCSLCPGDTSLVLRKGNLVDHLKRWHGDVEQSRLDEEKERFKKLSSVSKKGKFYNIHDQFLYGYPGGASSKLF